MRMPFLCCGACSERTFPVPSNVRAGEDKLDPRRATSSPLSRPGTRRPADGLAIYFSPPSRPSLCEIFSRHRLTSADDNLPPLPPSYDAAWSSIAVQVAWSMGSWPICCHHRGQSSTARGRWCLFPAGTWDSGPTRKPSPRPIAAVSSVAFIVPRRRRITNMKR